MRISDWSSDVCSSDLSRSAGAPVTEYSVPTASEVTAVAAARSATALATVGSRVTLRLVAVAPSTVVTSPTRDVMRTRPTVTVKIAGEVDQGSVTAARSEEGRGGKSGVAACRSWGP